MSSRNEHIAVNETEVGTAAITTTLHCSSEWTPKWFTAA